MCVKSLIAYKREKKKKKKKKKNKFYYLGSFGASILSYISEGKKSSAFLLSVVCDLALLELSRTFATGDFSLNVLRW